jgi:hypothetical protein
MNLFRLASSSLISKGIRFSRLVIGFWLILRLPIGCAKQTQPTGGPKDEKPPQLLATVPKNGSVNFKGTEVLLVFSEFIQLNKPKEEIIISPAVKETETIFRKDNVNLRFKEPLKDSTTYSINFREAVQDLTEKNSAKNLKLAFSTGPFLDSLSIAGSTFDLLTNKPLKDVTVAVHYLNDTFNIFKHKAEIFTKADEAGNFKIENLKATDFMIYAFYDKNKNLIVDSRSEKYGFLAKPISLKENQKGITVPLVSLDARALKLISARPYQNYFAIKANKSIDTYSIILENKQKPVMMRLQDPSYINLYQSFSLADSIASQLLLSDSVGNVIDTTLFVKFNEPSKDLKLDKFNTKIENSSILQKTNTIYASITLSKPLRLLTYDSILYKVDSANTFVFKPEEITYDTFKLLLQLTKKLPLIEEKIDTKTITQDQNIKTSLQKSDSKKNKILNQLYTGKGAFISIDNDSSSVMTEKTSTYKEEDLGIILVETKTKQSHYFIELLDSRGQAIKKVYNKSSDALTDLLPGEYALRLVIDLNNNQKWDAGNYLSNQEPEPIYYYYGETGDQTFSLKANWELGPLLINDEYRVNNLSKEKKK